jgi:hypothetical protein
MNQRWPAGERLSPPQADIVHRLTVDGPTPLRNLHKGSVRSLEVRGVVRLMRRDQDVVMVELHPEHPATVSKRPLRVTPTSTPTDQRTSPEALRRG